MIVTKREIKALSIAYGIVVPLCCAAIFFGIPAIPAALILGPLGFCIAFLVLGLS